MLVGRDLQKIMVEYGEGIAEGEKRGYFFFYRVN